MDATPILQPTIMAMSRGDEDVKEVVKIEEEEVMSGQVTGEEDTDTLAHLVAEMPESDIPRYIGGLMRCQGLPQLKLF